MHGHALRLLAEEEHIDEWADFAAGAIYGAIKRLAAEELIGSVRIERDGNYPERQVYEITPAGRESLAEIRQEALERIVHRPDPVDLALARAGDLGEAAIRDVLEMRLAELRARAESERIHLDRIGHFLTLMERHVMRHDLHRITGELAWHEELLAALPEIMRDEESRKGHAQ